MVVIDNQGIHDFIHPVAYIKHLKKPAADGSHQALLGFVQETLVF